MIVARIVVSLAGSVNIECSHNEHVSPTSAFDSVHWQERPLSKVICQAMSAASVVEATDVPPFASSAKNRIWGLIIRSTLSYEDWNKNNHRNYGNGEWLWSLDCLKNNSYGEDVTGFVMILCHADITETAAK